MQIKEEAVFVVLLVSVVVAWVGEAKSITRNKRETDDDNGDVLDIYDDVDSASKVGDAQSVTRYKRDTDGNDNEEDEDIDDGKVAVQRHLNYHRRHSV